MTKNLSLYDNEVCACLLLGDGSLDLSLMLEWVDAIITTSISNVQHTTLTLWKFMKSKLPNRPNPNHPKSQILIQKPTTGLYKRDFGYRISS